MNGWGRRSLRAWDKKAWTKATLDYGMLSCMPPAVFVCAGCNMHFSSDAAVLLYPELTHMLRHARKTVATHHSRNSPQSQLTTVTTHHSVYSPQSKLTTVTMKSPQSQLTTVTTHSPHISEGSLAQAEVQEEDWPWLVARLPSSPAKQTACAIMCEGIKL